MIASFRNAFSDLAAGLRLFPVWWALAMEEIGDSHRRTALGPLWILLNYLLFVGSFVLIFRRGFGVPHYEAYVSLGMLVWLFISEMVSQGVTLFVREEGFIRGTVLPLSVYVFRLVAQVTVRTGFAALGAVCFVWMSGLRPSSAWLALIPGVLLIVLTAPAAAIVLAVAGAVLPDLRFVVSNLVRLGMFLTPIFWLADESRGPRSLLYRFNPATHFLALVRDPIHLERFPWESWQICLVIAAGLWLLAILLLGHFRRRIIFLL